MRRLNNRIVEKHRVDKRRRPFDFAELSASLFVAVNHRGPIIETHESPGQQMAVWALKILVMFSGPIAQIESLFRYAMTHATAWINNITFVPRDHMTMELHYRLARGIKQYRPSSFCLPM